MQPGGHLRLTSAARSQTDWLLEGRLGDEGRHVRAKNGRVGQDAKDGHK